MKSRFQNHSKLNMAPDIPSRYGHDHNFPSPTPDLIPAREKCDSDIEHRLKCVLLGDGAVGKTSLIVSYTTNGYPTAYVPTAFDDYSARVNVDDQPVRLQMCDTAGQDDFDNMRPLCYPNTDVVLLCFSVVRPTSLCNVRDKWLPEIRKHMPKIPIILVGTQIDLRSSVDVLVDLARYSERPVGEDEARVFAEEHGAVRYVECSSLTQKNLKHVFDTAIEEGLDFQKHVEKKRKKSWRVKRSTSQKKLQTHLNSLQVQKKSRGKWKKLFCFA